MNPKLMILKIFSRLSRANTYHILMLILSFTVIPLQAQIELPGVETDDVKIALENGFLTISGEKKFNETDEIAGSRRIERRFGSFKRSFRLSDGIEQKKISADFKNGVLSVVVPKTKESIKKEIEIKIN